MDFITKSPGLQHIAETIFLQLDHTILSKCGKVSRSWENIVKNPWVCFKACVQKGLLTVRQQKKWAKVIQASLNSQEISEVSDEYLTLIHSGHFSKPWSRSPFHVKGPICKAYMKAVSEGNKNVVEILAPLMENPNASGLDGMRPMDKAAMNGHSEIVRILAPLLNNPNAQNTDGRC